MRGKKKSPSTRSKARLLALAFLVAPACQGLTATPTPLDDNGRFVAATVALTCLGRHVTAPKDLRSETRAIYERYGYGESMEFLALTANFENDEPIQARISEGIASCSRR